jgi:hypothetical protein
MPPTRPEPSAARSVNVKSRLLIMRKPPSLDFPGRESLTSLLPLVSYQW